MRRPPLLITCAEAQGVRGVKPSRVLLDLLTYVGEFFKTNCLGGVEMYATVKWFGVAQRAKIVVFKAGKPSRKGFHLPFDDDVENSVDECGRLAASISRTRSRIYELAACNEWDWFFTGTLNPEWCDVNNLRLFRARLSQSIRDFRKSSGCAVRYLLIPEQHKSGAWHMHGLFGGLPPEKLRKLTVQEHLPYKLLERIKAHDDLFSWDWYSSRFGFTTLTPMRNVAATAAYVTKYITKDLMSDKLDSNAHSYFASIGLKGADIIAEGDISECDIPASAFENDYVYMLYTDVDELNDIVAKMRCVH